MWMRPWKYFQFFKYAFNILWIDICQVDTKNDTGILWQFNSRIVCRLIHFQQPCEKFYLHMRRGKHQVLQNANWISFTWPEKKTFFYCLLKMNILFFQTENENVLSYVIYITISISRYVCPSVVFSFITFQHCISLRVPDSSAALTWQSSPKARLNKLPTF